MTNEKFLEDKYSNADRDFASFDDEVYFDENDGDFENADDVYAEGKKAKADYSKPFVIKLKNSTGSDIADVDFLNSNQSIEATNDGVTLGITPTYEYPNTTYAELIRKIPNETFQCALVRMESDDDDSATTIFQITAKNLRGSSYTDTYVPQINSFQNQNGVVDTYTNFIVNDATKITLASIPAGKYIKFTMFPSLVASTVATLKGQAPHKYNDPKISGYKMLNKSR